MNQLDSLLVVRAITLLLAAWSVRPLFCHVGLAGRLAFEIGRKRAVWPGPQTILAGMQATGASARAKTKPPHLYRQYLMAVSKMMLTALMFASLFYQFMQPQALSTSIGLLILVLAVAAIAFARFARAAEFYAAMVEWSLGELPRQAIDTDEPDEEVAHAFVAIRKGVNVICTTVWLAALSTIFIVGVWQSPHRRLSETAIKDAATGPLRWEHIEQITENGGALFLRNPRVQVSDIPSALLMVSMAECSLPGGRKVLALKRNQEPAAELLKTPDLCALLYQPNWRLPYPGLGSEYPQAIVALATEDELVGFVKSQRTMGLILTLLYLGFMANGLYRVVSLRRWLRVARVNKGKLNLNGGA